MQRLRSLGYCAPFQHTSRFLIQDYDRRIIHNDPSCFRKEGDNDKDDMNFGPKPEALQITTQVAYYAAA